jgi:hypothetical protein
VSRIRSVLRPSHGSICWQSLILLVFTQLAVPAVEATTLLRLDDGQLVERSALIVTATCDTTRTEWIGGTLFTVAAVRVERALKGEPAARLEVLIPGGVDRDREVPVAVVYPGAPSVVPGERVVLFLTPTGPAGGHEAGNVLATKSHLPVFAVTGFSQGKLSIVEDAAGEPVVVHDLAGVGVLDGGRVRAGGRRTEPLSVFEERIVRRLAAARKGGRR